MNLVYLVAVGENDARFHESVQWCVKSLRRWGEVTDEIIVVTDSASEALQAGIGGDAHLLEVDPKLLCDPAHGRSDRDKYLMARLRIHHFVDLSAYETVMYVDADILAIRSIRHLFDGVNEFRYSREFQPMSAPMYNAALTDDELEVAKWRRGINSGVYVAPASYLPECLDAWKAVLDESPSGDAYDQPALNALVLRNLIRARPLSAFSVAYPVYVDFPDTLRPQTALLHYCGNRRKKFARMRRHFGSLERQEPLQIHFDLDEDMTRPSDGTERSSVAGPERDGLVIAIDGPFEGVESHALINQHYARELRARGHEVVPMDRARSGRVDAVIHHDFERDFLTHEFIEGVPHVAVRTSDFGPYPTSWVERINARYAQLWVYTQWVRQHALEGGIEPGRIRVVPNGIDPRVFRPVGEKMRLPTTKSFRFLYVGGMAVRKGFDVLLEAYASEFAPEEDVCLVIKDNNANVFYRDSHFGEEIARLQNDASMPELVYFGDHLPSLELAALYRACSVGVWPYRAEGFLIPALECMACGTPAVLPEFGPTADFSTSRTSFLVKGIRVQLPLHRTYRLKLGFEVDAKALDICEIKPAVLARRMREAYQENSDNMKARAAAGVAMAHGRFAWPRIGEDMETHLLELVGRRTPG